ncbi:MAG: helix-turn-helix domain-containing protein [Candidatus Margulisbacteria bacterium]|jgi:transcriptional regulator with XRE-family HTH domain|nr:helix-turn-helix domain-containing protein [Candidatus Margulisiibacteriota bacterium]
MDKSNLEKELKILISSKLKQIRKQSGNTIEQMAEEIGIEYTNFWNLYSGVNLPRLSTLFQLSKTYNFPIGYWFEGLEKLTVKEKAAARQKTKLANLLNVYQKLDENTQDVVLNILKSHARRRKHTIK